jgi:hypothetical protein
MPQHYHPGSLDYGILGCPDREININSCFAPLCLYCMVSAWLVHVHIQHASVIQTLRLSTYTGSNLGLA